LVDFDKLNRASTLCVVTATDVESGTLGEFSNLHAHSPPCRGERKPAPSFPMTLMGGRGYWDGGLISNTPLRPAINAIERLDDNAAVEWELIVIDLFEPALKLPENMAEVTERSFQELSRVRMEGQ
jgi:NTE family protein